MWAGWAALFCFVLLPLVGHYSPPCLAGRNCSCYIYSFCFVFCLRCLRADKRCGRLVLLCFAFCTGRPPVSPLFCFAFALFCFVLDPALVCHQSPPCLAGRDCYCYIFILFCFCVFVIFVKCLGADRRCGRIVLPRFASCTGRPPVSSLFCCKKSHNLGHCASAHHFVCVL